MNDRGGIPVCPSTRILTAKAKFCLTMFFHVMDPGNMVELIFKDVPQSEERELAFTGACDVYSRADKKASAAQRAPSSHKAGAAELVACAAAQAVHNVKLGDRARKATGQALGQ